MIGTEGFLNDSKRPLEERLGLLIPTLFAVQLRKIVQRVRDIDMIGTNGILSNGKRSLIQWLTLEVPTLFEVKRRKPVQRYRMTLPSRMASARLKSGSASVYRP
jgi:hypothetical protein